ncbi:hypothetical protein ACS0TY_013141 [Phlomoides rotata]
MLGYFLFNVAAPLILNQPKIRIPQNTNHLSGEDWLLELLNGADTQFYNALRLTKPCFRALVDEFKTHGLLFNSQQAHVSIEEKVAIFLRTVGHQHKHHVLGDRFQHSLSTINHAIHDVLRALLTLSPLYITQPDFVNTPQRVVNSHDFYPYFKDVIGAMDGSLIPAWVLENQQVRFRSRKGTVSQNVLAICDFNLLFTYVYAGWEESASDAAVLSDAIQKDTHHGP